MQHRNNVVTDTLVVFAAWIATYYAVSFATGFSDDRWGLAVGAGWAAALVASVLRSMSLQVAVAVSGLWLLFDLALFFLSSEESYPDRPDRLTLFFLCLLLVPSAAVASPVAVAWAGKRVLMGIRRSGNVE